MQDQAFTLGVLCGAAVGAFLALLLRDQRRPAPYLPLGPRAGLSIGAADDADLVAAQRAAERALAQLRAERGRAANV